MKLAAAIGVVLALLSGVTGVARAGESAQEDADLNLIPPSPQTPPVSATPVAPDALQKIFLEDAYTQTWLRSSLVPVPPPPSPRWEERLLFDARKAWEIGAGLRFTYSGRL